MSSSSSLLFLLLLPLLRRSGAAADSGCGASFRPGQEDFVLDVEDSVRDGAALLATAYVRSPEDCELRCCGNPRCNLALLEPPGTGAADNHTVPDARTCVLFSCVSRNRFVCRFVNQIGYQSYVKESVFQKHLEGPQEPGEPIAIAGRDVIVQPGQTVTLNGTESLTLGDAHITHYRWRQLSGDPGVKMEVKSAHEEQSFDSKERETASLINMNVLLTVSVADLWGQSQQTRTWSIQDTDLPDQVWLSNLQIGSYVFQLTVEDSNRLSAVANVTVLVLNPEQTALFCLAPRKVGPCRAAFPRWHYDATTGSCEQFMFGGCKQNHNNYLSEEECMSACRGVTATAERGAALPATEDCGSPCGLGQLTCRSGCCVDRSVECDGVRHCSDGSDEEHCGKLNQTFSRLLNINVNQTTARCTEPPRTGPCRASHTRWYYDPLNRKCYRFTFGGCDGNNNNFEEEQKCSKTCTGVSERHLYSRGMFDRFEVEEKTDESGSIALAVLLSVAILALLAILTYCFLKARRKRSHRSVHTGPAHVALSEQDTLVYNSTTKPI
ncbi:kunitz-type protease inhibitor 1-like isoform X2 [Echeneis naucrates]|uniref:kunitz-type protease inhibitor 1-like isoform X2 n=1 Tax=Echeneis naucrates TaxID=173247 RepID=UPI001113D962|nr:kunitz-type protease inhibitor 1-like isoform X2 [Echeneis naucrates]